MCADI